MTQEYFKIAVKNLRTRPLRSWLTILGIVIGVFLIITLISLSEGLKGAVLSQLNMMGKNLIMVFPGRLEDIFASLAGGFKVTEEDQKAIEKVPGVEIVLPTVYKTEIVRYQGESKAVMLNGLFIREAADIYQQDLGWTTVEGRWPLAGKREFLVGNLVPIDIFPGMKVGTEASIKGQKFEVVGILKSVGSKQDDSIISLDIPFYQDITGERKNDSISVMVTTKPGYQIDAVAADIKEALQENSKRIRGEDSPTFSVLTSEKIADIAGSILGLIQAVIFGFASIAIIVGGIGIMNTMYTSVRERTKEIGILKAVGARQSTITSIFLIESGIIGLIGGAGGVISGVLFAKILEFSAQIHPVFYIKAAVSPGLILFGLGFSFLIGCLSGYLPAREASKLKPIEALRYE